MATKKTTTKKAASAKKATKKEVKHITPTLICDVLNGKYGAEGERNIKLTAEGYNPSAVTRKINELKKLAEELKPIQKKAGVYYDCLNRLLGLAVDCINL